MRTAVIVALAIIVACCSSREKASDTFKVISPILKAPDANQEGADTLYQVLIRKGYEHPHENVRVTIVTREMVALEDPDVETHYIAAVIEKVGTRWASIAVFDPSQQMNVVAFISQEFPDAMYFDSNGEQPSGQGSDLAARSIKLSEGGDVIAITANTTKQYVKAIDEDENIWLFALYQNHIFMIHAFSLRFNHHVTGDGNYSKDISLHTQLGITGRKTRGMYDIVLKLQVDETGSGGSHSEKSEEHYIFNGKEYTRK